MRVEWSNPAREDLEELVRYIEQDSPHYARRFGEKVVLATRRLKDFAQSGRIIPEMDDPNFREIIVQDYRVMYRVEHDSVLILAVMHGSRDFTSYHKEPSE